MLQAKGKDEGKEGLSLMPAAITSHETIWEFSGMRP